VPDTDAPIKKGLTGDQVEFLGQVLTANASWSASIHELALDGQERTAAEWAERYSKLAHRLDFILRDAHKWDRETELFDRLCNTLDAQGFYPEFADESVARYRERLAEREAEKAKAAA